MLSKSSLSIEDKLKPSFTLKEKNQRERINKFSTQEKKQDGWAVLQDEYTKSILSLILTADGCFCSEHDLIIFQRLKKFYNTSCRRTLS